MRVHNEKRRTTAIPTRRMSSSLGSKCLSGPTLSFLGTPSSSTAPIRAKSPHEGTTRNRRLLPQPEQSSDKETGEDERGGHAGRAANRDRSAYFGGQNTSRYS